MTRIEQLLQLLSSQPNDCFILHALGLEHIKVGDYPQAKDYFEQVLRINENYVGTYYHLGRVCVLLGEKAEADAVYTKGIDIATRLNDRHNLSELLLAKDDL